MAECAQCKAQFSGFWSALSWERWSALSVRRGWEEDFNRIRGCKSRLFYPIGDNLLCTKCMISENAQIEDRIHDATKSFKGVFRNDLPARYGRWSEIGWIKLFDHVSPTEYEREMKRLSVMARGDAAIKSYWSKSAERYVAGYGKKGNPYYRTRYSYSGEALVVQIRK